MRIKTKILEPRWLLVFVFFVAGAFGGGLALYLWINTNSPSLFKIHPENSPYKYVNPLLAVDLDEGKGIAQHTALKLKFEGLIHRSEADKAIASAAVYFRDIEPARWVDINGDTQFSPGKLLKLPIMMAYYKTAEGDPSILGEKLLYSGGPALNRTLLPSYQPLLAGESYAVEDLIRQMIVYSDDNAANLLFDHINKETLHETFSDLSINFRQEKNTNDFISLKGYSLFFRVLYNATYLNREYSEKALTLLIEADNAIGLGAALPHDIGIANRYGGRRYVDADKSTNYEMYDCGIFYYPSHPYLLCAVARGKDLNAIKDFLKQVGDAAYEEMRYDYSK